MSHRFNCAVPRFRQPLDIVPIDPVCFEFRDVVECSDNLEYILWNRRRVVTSTVQYSLVSIAFGYSSCKVWSDSWVSRGISSYR